MMRFLASRAFSLIAALAMLFSPLFLSLTVRARTPPERWWHEVYEGRDFYALGNPVASVNALILACGTEGDGDVLVRMGYLIGGKHPPPDTEVTIITSALPTTHTFGVDEESGTTVACRACAENFTFFWNYLRRSKSVTMTFADGRRATLQMPNVAQVLPPAPCPGID